MAAVSAAPGATTITPPSSSNEDHADWKSHSARDYLKESNEGKPYNSHESTSVHGRNPLSPQNGNLQGDPFAKRDPTEPFPATKDQARKAINGENKRLDMDSSDVMPDDNSKWIHRDKLAKIESEELQAAGFVLPKPRAQSRPRRERSTEKLPGRRATDASEQEPLPDSRKNSIQKHEKTPLSDSDATAWDLRLPEEIAEDDGEFWVRDDSVGPKGSRIPVAKISPAPIPTDYLARDTLVARKPSGSLVPDDEFSLSIQKQRSRSGSIPTLATLDSAAKTVPGQRSATDGGTSPKKSTPNGARKPSAATASKQGATTGRPKTRSGTDSKGSGSSSTTTRPTTRSGELSKGAPEGEPPWMISAYKPDPRLPPDQQLLPTVAKRLQQEQWEKEGKFGNIYDTNFRPLNEEGYLKPPELQRPTLDEPTEDNHDGWPLRAEAKSPTPSRPGTSSYSTMPKIQDTPALSPLHSPRLPGGQQQPMQATRIPDAEPEPQEQEKEKSKGCGCCLVM